MACGRSRHLGQPLHAPPPQPARPRLAPPDAPHAGARRGASRGRLGIGLSRRTSDLAMRPRAKRAPRPRQTARDAAADALLRQAATVLLILTRPPSPCPPHANPRASAVTARIHKGDMSRPRP